MTEDYQKRIVGLYGEMALAMELHKKGWQVYRAYIDEQIDFIIAKYYCSNCDGFTELRRRKNTSRRGTFPTNLCAACGKKKVEVHTRFVQVKTSAGEKKKNKVDYSFHAKLRHHVDKRSFYVWIALLGDSPEAWTPHFYIFKHAEVNKFDNLKLDSYQGTDNQKTTLYFNEDGKVMNKGRKHDYRCFQEFHNNFDKLNMRCKTVYPPKSS